MAETIYAFSRMGLNSLRCTKILLQHHLFLSFLLSLFFPCKDTFMDDYDGILNYNGLKHVPSEILTTFDSLFMESKYWVKKYCSKY